MANVGPLNEQASHDINQDWGASDERKKVDKAFRWYGIALAVWVLPVGLVLLYLYRMETLFEKGPQVLFGFLTPAAIGLFWLSTYTNSLRQAVRERYWRQQAEGLSRREQDIGESEDPTTFFKLWATTQDRIKLYHDIATDQSRTSFRDARRATVFGFVVILVAGLLAYAATNSSASIAAGAIGVAGAGLSAYIGSTFMKSQAEASAQLREYFLQPVEFSRILAAERLVTIIDDPAERGKAVIEIIRGMMPHNQGSAGGS